MLKCSTPRRCLTAGSLLLCILGMAALAAKSPDDAALLFYLSGAKGFSADFARGEARPDVVTDVEIIPDGASGPGFRCPHVTQRLAYWAPGNIYAQRGTLAFFWRARDSFGKTPFPIFQVSYADHSSIDMAWLRIDYNGQGFDAFVTDASLARARVSYSPATLLKPDQWIHFALAWDETQGIRFYLDGKLVAKKDLTAVFYAGLDKFGAHGDVIGPQDVYTAENGPFRRGGDIDEIRIYDQSLSPENVSRIAGKDYSGAIPILARKLDNPTFRDEWGLRYGWNRAGDIPPYVPGNSVSVRKVEIHDVYDLKQWIWKANDGIRETTWPNPYNRSRLPGRDDYFPRPDWNCYSTSGKSITFSLPDEPWNQLEIAGSAHGSVSYLKFDKESQTHKEIHLSNRPPNQERTFHRLATPAWGGKIRFDNTAQETPIGEFSAFYVSAGSPPQGSARLSYTIVDARVDNPTLDTLESYIRGRFMIDEQSIVVALPQGAPRTVQASQKQNILPLVHVLVPFEFRLERPGEYNRRFSYTWENIHDGLDGIVLDLPPVNVKATHGDYFPLNIQIKDPLWPDRNLLDFTFSIRPGEPKTLWLDTRDRILPNGYSFYMTVAGAGSDFGPHSLQGARIQLVFKNRKQAAVEHEIDRFTQVRDNVGNFLQWGSNKKRLKLYDRYSRDIADLLRVNPDHLRGRYYWSYLNPEQGWPAYEHSEAPPGVPLWAFRQIENLKLLKYFINWWIDNRQIGNGELGGGLSDDGDLTHLWPGAALMGIEPEKITRSMQVLMDAFYDNGMFTHGLNTLMMDQLHVYEEGINVQPQVMLLEYGDPKIVERMMETSRALERITGIGDRGHRHIRSLFFSATQISEDGPWAWMDTAQSPLILHPALVLVEYNGHPVVKKLLLELADGLLAHRKKDAHGNYSLPEQIAFPSGEERGSGLGSSAHLFWAAWRWTGDKKYLIPILDRLDHGDFGILGSLNANLIDLLGKRDSWGKQISSRVTSEYSSQSPRSSRSSGGDYYRHVAWSISGDNRYLEEYYADQIRRVAQRMPMFTEDHWWVDRVSVPSKELQRSRLGGVAEYRGAIYPGHVVSWRFNPPATAESVAILVSEATTKAVKIIAFNLEKKPVRAFLTGWDVDPGTWELSVGLDHDGDQKTDRGLRRESVVLERTRQIELTFQPESQTIIELKLVTPATPMWNRPDLALGRDDVAVEGNQVRVRVHNLGAVDAPASSVALQDPSGRTVAGSLLPALKAPLDLLPKTLDVTIQIPAGSNLKGYRVRIDPENKIREITTGNNEFVIH